MPINKQRGVMRSTEDCLVSHVQTMLLDMDLASARLCVGLSGGVDSVVLLHILTLCQHTLPFQLSAVHVNHGIHVNARQWGVFAQNYAASIGVQCTVQEVQLMKKGGDSLEAVARHARYAIYQQIDCEAIVLAHHQDDQAETVLLQLFRGSGVVGLAAMPKKRQLQKNQLLVRPLLDIPRKELLAYANAHHLKWVEDESNEDTGFRRNFLRHDIIPKLQSRYPGLSRSLSRASGYFAETNDLLSDLAKLDCPQINHRVPLPKTLLLSLTLPRQRNVLYWYLRAHGIFPEEKWIEEILKVMLHASQESMPTWELQDKALYFSYGELVITPTFNLPDKPIYIHWQGEAEIRVAEWRGTLQLVEVKGGGISIDALKSAPLILQGREGRARLRLASNRPSHTVKHLWQVRKVPFWQRQRVPLVWFDGQLLMIPGVGMGCELEVKQDDVGITTIWHPWDFDLKAVS